MSSVREAGGPNSKGYLGTLENFFWWGGGGVEGDIKLNSLTALDKKKKKPVKIILRSS